MNWSISVDKLSFSYGKRKIFDNLSFQIRSNVLTIFLGRNGSGKSTLLKIIAGILQAHEGIIKIHNLHNRKSSLSFLGQYHKSIFPFSVRDVVLTGRASYVTFFPRKEDFNIVDQTLELVGISHLANRLYTEISGGERQLVMIARCLAQQPSILLLDEPLSHLDFVNQLSLMRLFKRLIKEGLTIVAVLHDPNWAFLFSDDILFIHNGKVYRENNSNWCESPLIKEIYGDSIVKVPYAGKMMIQPTIES
ncbi:MAG: ABC transporter ATP-binding protein [Chitinispirillaceae bacterium]|nr:ABC transporter ATP-binding protein [Chitinispirillaceae bacterium]